MSDFVKISQTCSELTLFRQQHKEKSINESKNKYMEIGLYG